MNSERSSSVPDARGKPKDFGRLSDLHPDGFSHVSRALLRHQEAHAVHLGVFAAIAETARGLPETAGGHRWIASGVPRARLHELTGIRKPETLRQKIRDLERWGFILELRRPNAASDFEILPTGNGSAPDLSLEARPSDSGALPAAPRPHQDRTTVLGVSGNGALQVAPPPHQDPGVSDNGVFHQVDEPPPMSQIPDHRPPGVTEHKGAAPSADGVLPSYIEERLNENCRCAESHPPFLTHRQYMTLKKATRRRFVDAAVDEVAFRLGNPSIATEIQQPYTMVRNIAECYSDRCRTSHGDLHGEKALMYHRGRRADIEQVLRSKGGTEPDPGSLGPLQSIVGDLLADSSAFFDDPDDQEQRRAGFVAALEGMQQEDEHR